MKTPTINIRLADGGNVEMRTDSSFDIPSVSMKNIIVGTTFGMILLSTIMASYTLIMG